MITGLLFAQSIPVAHADEILLGGPVLSEFLARNDSGLEDEDGETSDWIEVINASAEAIDLEGWHLTDNPENLTRWAFPAITLGPQEYLLVFASGKDRRVKNRPYLSGLILGLVFGLALGPCALAFMAPILGIVMSSISTQFWFCIGLIVAFIVGHCGFLVLVGTFTEIVKKLLSWNVASKGTQVLRKICGILIIAGAVITFWKVL